MSNPKAGPNSSAPTTAEIVGGVYNATPPVLNDGQATALQVDINGKLITSGSGGTSNVNIADVNGNPPALTNPLPVELSDGTNAFGTSGNPLSENVAQWGGTAVSASPASGSPAVGTEVAPVVRPILRKFGYTPNTTQLGNGGVFRGPGTLGAGANAGWVDASATGGHFIAATVFSDQGSSQGALVIQQSDDFTNANMMILSARNPAVGAGLFTLESVLKCRYWRVVYTNGSTPTTQFEIAITESTEVPYVIIASSTSLGGTTPVQGVQSSLNQNGSPTSALRIVPLNISVNTEQNAGSIFIGDGQLVAGNDAIPATLGYAVTSSGTLPAMSALRTPNVFKTASVSAATTGNSAVWTPTSGKKFRLMRFQITAQGLAATATGVVTVSFQDATTGITIGTYDVDVPAVANVVSGVTNISGAWIDLGNGFLSAAANNVLNFNISAAGAGTVGTYRINVCGTEE
jgi:hypothetical protein